MQTHNLKPRTKLTRSKAVGRGGTRGKTSGRGTKGQNARAGRKKRPELRDFIKRFPKLRGRGKSSFKTYEIKPVAVNLKQLESIFSDGDTVSPDTLLAKKAIGSLRMGSPKVKILGTGELSKKLNFENVTMSLSAKEKIEKAGGKITI
ncbi:MAG: 50S ribosomal protein L15 [bacterium]|nr:50S ribosomal protein L15 [bacterium]